MNVAAGSSRIHAVHQGAGQTYTILRFYVYFATLPDKDCALAWYGYSTGAPLGPNVRFKASDSKIYAAVGSTFGSTGVAVTTGVWYRIDTNLNMNGTPADICDVQVDGVACAQIVLTGGSGTGVTTFGYGVVGALDDVTADVYFDDMLASVTTADYPLGAGRVLSYIPNADGTHNVAGTNDFERTLTGTDIDNTTTTAYQLVDDRPLETAEGDFINMKLPVNATDYVEVLFEDSVESAAPVAFSVVAAYHQASVQPGNMEIRLNDNGSMGVVYTATAIDGVTVLNYRYKIFIDPPSAATVWVLGGGGNGDFNNLKVRFGSPAGLDVNPDQYFDGIIIEAEFAGIVKRVLRTHVSQAVQRAAVI
jgi:hypothetical protein